MSDELVERVARAIFLAAGEDEPDIDFAFDKVKEHEREFARNLARAAIEALQSPSSEGMRETWQTISDWCDATFGPASPLRMAARANEEMAELIDKATQTETYDDDVLIEAADVVICLARFPGIWEAVEKKMAINRARKWRLTGEGTGYHVPDAALHISMGEVRT